MGMKIGGEVGEEKEGTEIMEDLMIEQATYQHCLIFLIFCSNASKINVEYDLV